MRLYKCRRSPFWPISIRRIRCSAMDRGRTDRNNDYPLVSSNQTLKVFFSHLNSFTIYYTVLTTMDAFITRSIEADSGEIGLSTLSSLPSTIPSTRLHENAETPPPTGWHAHLLFQRRDNHIIVRGKEFTKTKALASRREDRKEATSPIWKYGGSYTNSQGKHFFYCNLCAIKTGTV